MKEKSERITARISPNIKNTLEQAALKEAKQITAEDRVINLSDGDAETVFSSIEQIF